MTESDDQDISMDDDEQSLASIPNFIRKEEQIAEFVKEAGENFKMKCEMYEKLYEANVAMNDLVSSRLTRLEMDIEMPSLVHYFMRIFVISRHYTFGVGLDKLVERLVCFNPTKKLLGKIRNFIHDLKNPVIDSIENLLCRTVL
ncbi:hypothetical protein ACOME3_002241 [Neoechinorhynchus agilis]